MKPTLLSAGSLLGLGIAVALSGCGGGGGGGGATADSFVFATATLDSGRYVRIDRTGQPLVAAALLDPALTINDTSIPPAPINPGNQFNTFNNQRDQFNRGEPGNDARDFAVPLTTGPQSRALQNIHYETRPSLTALGLTPCSTETVSPPASRADIDISVCVAQVAPVVLPDVITVDFAAAAGWPNGRHFDDPVSDRLLAAALLRISGVAPPHNLNSLVGVINTWNGPAGAGCVAPCAFTGDETLTISPAIFPYMRPSYP